MYWNFGLLESSSHVWELHSSFGVLHLSFGCTIMICSLTFIFSGLIFWSWDVFESCFHLMKYYFFVIFGSLVIFATISHVVGASLLYSIVWLLCFGAFLVDFGILLVCLKIDVVLKSYSYT